MPRHFRENWSRKIEDVIRSRHYTWLGQGLGGDPVDEAMVALMADVMHICKRQGIDMNWLLEQSTKKYEQEENESTRRSASLASLPNTSASSNHSAA